MKYLNKIENKSKNQMINFIKNIEKQAQKNPKKIVFPEGFEPRILKAVKKIVEKKTAHPILIGRPAEIIKTSNELNLKLDFDQIPIVNPEETKEIEKYALTYFKLRKDKGITKDEALATITKPNYLGTMIVYKKDADGMISGTTWSTAETVRPALQIIKTEKKFHKVSGFFFMLLKKRLLLFADCAIIINPNSHDLVDIAEDTALTAKNFGVSPKIAFLSFSTNGSANHPFVDKVKEAVNIFNYKNPKIIAEGEMQVDSALVPDICKRKFPNSHIKGDANILIFPNLESANIAYKLVERLGGAKAIGPILQGLKKPINDLSRGCSVDDIVNLTAITTIQAQNIGRTHGSAPTTL